MASIVFSNGLQEITVEDFISKNKKELNELFKDNSSDFKLSYDKISKEIIKPFELVLLFISKFGVLTITRLKRSDIFNNDIVYIGG